MKKQVNSLILNTHANFKRPLFVRFALFLIMPAVICGVALLYYLLQSLPVSDQSLSVQGISGTVQVVRDAHGVPHISAESDNDVYFAMGFVHAQDRLWQLELQKRLAQGRLSEVFGRKSLDSDVWMRTLGLYPAAQNAWSALSDEARQSLLSYAKGVNAYLALNHPLPVEFNILGIEPEPWSALDSLAWVKVFALNFSAGMWDEVESLVAKEVLNDEQIQQLFYATGQSDVISPDDYSGDNISDVAKLLSIRSVFQEQWKVGGPYVGSNAWAISAKHSQTGYPLLANDPHVGLQMPSLWYVVQQNGEKLDTQGMSLIGLPVIIFGRNDKIAWAGTSLMADVQDLFYEQSHPTDPSLYLYDGQWLPFEEREEIIHIKADFPAALNRQIEPIKIKVRTTKNGPIISDVVDGGPTTLSLKWTALRDYDTSYEAFFKISYASNWSQFTDALNAHVAPALNMLFVDEVNAGYRAAGAIPVRGSKQGKFPLTGWQSKNSWLGDIPAAHLPSNYAPESGIVVSANNKITDSDYPYFITDQWAPDYRAKRIRALIEGAIADNGKISIEDFEQMHGDTIDLSAQGLIARLQSVSGNSVQQRSLLQMLKQWSGDMSSDSAAAALFTVWVEQLRIALFSDDLQGFYSKNNTDETLKALLEGVSTFVLLEILNNDELNWCDNKLTDERESCDAQILTSLDKAFRKLTKISGDIGEWSWGSIHNTAYLHQPFSNTNVLKLVFERLVPTGGSPDTINVASGTFTQSENYRQDFGAGFRQIMQVGPNPQHLYMNSTGQSGNPFSTHYDDMVEPFNLVQYHTFLQLTDELQISRLTLTSAQE